MRTIAINRRHRLALLAAMAALLAWTGLARSAAAQVGIGDCEETGSITGTVTDEGGAALSGATVSAFADHGAWPGGAEAETDADGRYRLDEVCYGDWIVAAAHFDGDAVLIGVFDADADGEPDLAELDAELLEGIDIVLSEQAGERGVIEPGPGEPITPCDGESSISGNVSLPEGDPAVGAQVFAFGAESFGEALSDDVGNYRIEGLCAGEYHIFADYWDETTAYQGAYDVDGDLHPDLVDLDEAQAAEGIDIQLTDYEDCPGEPGLEPEPHPEPFPEPGPSCENPQGMIAGRLTDAAGEAAAGAIALVIDAASGWLLGEAEADSDGAYLAQDLCAGEYMLLAVAPSLEMPEAIGFHDADGDGEPDSVELATDDALAEGVDVQLTMELRIPGALMGGADPSWLPGCRNCGWIDPVAAPIE